MKKIIFIVLLVLITVICKAPEFHTLCVFDPISKVQPYERIWQAVCMEESKMNPTAHNPKDPNGGSHGISQIGLERLNDYNIKTHQHYTVNDLYNPEVSKKIFMYYAAQLGPYQQDLIIRKWNGSGKATYDYLRRVKRHL